MVRCTQSWEKNQFPGSDSLHEVHSILPRDILNFLPISIALWSTTHHHLEANTHVKQTLESLQVAVVAVCWMLCFFFSISCFFFFSSLFLLYIHSLLAYFLRFFQVVISHHLCLRRRAPPTKTEFHFFRSFFSFLSPYTSYTLLASPRRLVDLHSVLSAHVKQTRAPKYLQKVFFLSL